MNRRQGKMRSFVSLPHFTTSSVPAPARFQYPQCGSYIPDERICRFDSSGVIMSNLSAIAAETDSLSVSPDKFASLLPMSDKNQSAVCQLRCAGILGVPKPRVRRVRGGKGRRCRNRRRAHGGRRRSEKADGLNHSGVRERLIRYSACQPRTESLSQSRLPQRAAELHP